MKKRVSGFCGIAVITAISLGHTLSIEGTAPKITIQDPTAKANPQVTEFANSLNTELSNSFAAIKLQAETNLAGFKEQKELAQGFSNANAYSMHSATLQGFQNYSLFAVAAGLMVGVQAPSTSFTYLKKAANDIQEKGDIYAGVGTSVSFVNLGINAGFLLPGLYLNAKFGALALDIEDFSMDFSVVGVGVNYRLLEPKSLAGLVKWRGISVGSGFYMQSNKITMEIESQKNTQKVELRKQLIGNATGADSIAKATFMDQIGYTTTKPNADMTLTPVFNMGLDVSTITIPLDAVTSISVLWGMFNLTGGLGIDLNFGSNEITLKGESDIAVSSDSTKATFTPANVKISGASDNGPSLARLRVMTGLGLGLGPVKIDVPLIYYPSSGMAFGLTLAVVW